MSNEFNQHLKSKGTQHELTTHDSLPQNGVSERGMHTHGEVTCTLLILSGLLHPLWAEAMVHKCWIQDWMPTQALEGKTPYKMISRTKPNLTGIQCFGAAAYVKIKNARKLDKCALKGHFIGYDSESKGYQIYWPEKCSISIEHNVVFHPEDSFKESVEIMNEEESRKILQNSTEKSSETPTENPNDQNPTENLTKKDLPEDPNPPDYTAEPIDEHPHHSRLRDILPDSEPNTGWGF